MNPGEDHCYSKQVRNIQDRGSKKDPDQIRPSLAPLYEVIAVKLTNL